MYFPQSDRGGLSANVIFGREEGEVGRDRYREVLGPLNESVLERIECQRRGAAAGCKGHEG